MFGYFDNQLDSTTLSTSQVISLASQLDTEDDVVDPNKQLESICQVLLRTKIQLAELLFCSHVDETSVNNLFFDGKFIHSKDRAFSRKCPSMLSKHYTAILGARLVEWRTLALDKCNHRYTIQDTATYSTHRLKNVGA